MEKQDEEELVEWIKQNSTIYDKHLKGYKYNQSILDQVFEYQYQMCTRSIITFFLKI